MAQSSGWMRLRRVLKPGLRRIPAVRRYLAEKVYLEQCWVRAAAEGEQLRSELTTQHHAVLAERRQHEIVLDALQEELGTVNARCRDLADTQERLLTERNDLDGTVRRLNGELSDAREQIEQRTTQASELARALDDQRTAIETLRREYEQLSQLLILRRQEAEQRLTQHQEEFNQLLLRQQQQAAHDLAQKQEELNQTLARHQEEAGQRLAQQQAEMEQALAQQRQEAARALADKQGEMNQALARQQEEAAQQRAQAQAEMEQALARQQEEAAQRLTQKQEEADRALSSQQQEAAQLLAQKQEEMDQALARQQQEAAQRLAQKQQEMDQALAGQQQEAAQSLASKAEESLGQLARQQAEFDQRIASVQADMNRLLNDKQAEWTLALEQKQSQLNALIAERDSLVVERIRYQDVVLGKITSLQAEQSILRRSLVQADAGISPDIAAQSRELYLDLLEDSLTGMTLGDDSIAPTQSGFDPVRREMGRDWPRFALTMIGKVRLHSLRDLAEAVIADTIPGDFLEAGVWRGGACIFLRGLLKVSGIVDRKIWVADSFAGLPPPNPVLYPADAGDPHHTLTPLAVPLDEVRSNFARYGLLDDQVRFLPGWFKDTLPSAPIERLALLRLDGDMYESTIQTLAALYGKVSPGGVVIVDDYILPGCRKAVDDFRRQHGISSPLQPVDGAAVYWRRALAEEHAERPRAPARRKSRA